MKKAMFPNETNPEEAIERLQEMNDNFEFFKIGASKLMEKELIKDVIAKNFQGKIKTDLSEIKCINKLISMAPLKLFEIAKDTWKS